MYLNSKQEVLNSKDEIISKSVFNLLSSCIKYKRISTFYEIATEYKDYLSSDDLSLFTKEIYKNFSDDENLYPTILRLASTTFSLNGNGKDLELLKILYPKYFYDLISESCKEYNLDEFILLSLIRTESYFDKNVFSVAGASGLTQLMKTTATDIARKLRIKDFDLLDAKTNITFGSFYLNELIRRLDGSVLKAIVSYNTGITRVRRWATQFENVPTDIWIEMFPYQESRNYGKRVLANAFVYGLLYYNKTSYEIVDMFMR
jgi:soluble lytic murein transglycosylase